MIIILVILLYECLVSRILYNTHRTKKSEIAHREEVARVQHFVFIQTFCGLHVRVKDSKLKLFSIFNLFVILGIRV